jgi:hypothetical protein
MPVNKGPNYRDLGQRDRSGRRIVEVNGEKKAVVPLTQPICVMVPSIGTRHNPMGVGKAGSITPKAGLNDFR